MSRHDDAQPPESSGELVPKVFEGELVPREEKSEDRAPARAAIRRSVIESRAYVVRRVRESDRLARLRAVAAYRARSAPRDVVRLLWFLLRGHGRWIVKAWTWASYGDLRADARAARIAGDAEARRTAQETIRADARARWAKLGLVARRIAISAAVVLVLLIVLALIELVFNREDLPDWLATVYAVRDDLETAVPVLLSWLLVLGPLGWACAAVWEGRDCTPGAGWLTRPDRDDADSWVDERMISRALAHLGVGPLNAFFKDGGELVYLIAARRDGDGTFAQVRLPLGVTADMVADRRTTLAANLGRASLETWPTKGDEDGVLDLWVADKGKLSGGAGPWPLLLDGEVDLFEGVPFGLTQRGLVINAPLIESNWLIGGRPGQGKTSAMRTLLLGAALDPTSELWVFVMGESPDFEPMVPRLSRYGMGMDDSVAAAAVQALDDLTEEMERRGRVLRAQPGRPPKVSRKLADRAGFGLHPLVLAVDECHELFQHKTYGKRAEELAVRLIKRGRKYGIILMLATQSPTKESIPKEITRNVSCGVAFAVADHIANDGLLGAGRFRAGIRATELRTKTDRGTCVAVGVTDEPWELVRTYYVRFEDGIDLVSPVVARSLTIMYERGRELAATAREPEEEKSPPDLLADIADAMGREERTRTQTVLTRLAAHNPEEYDGWALTDLSRELREHGLRTYKSDGKMVLRREDVAEAQAARQLEQAREDDREPAGRQGVLPDRADDETPSADQRKHRSGRQYRPTGESRDTAENPGFTTQRDDSLPDDGGGDDG